MEQFIGEIRIFGGNFAPNYWAACDGQSIAITQNYALYSILGITFGGDGKTNFCLPDLRGRAPLDMGAGAGLTSYPWGASGGSATNTLDESTVATHNHLAMGDSASGGQQDPANHVWGTLSGRSPTNLYTNNSPTVSMSSQALVAAGEGSAHNNMQPYLSLMFIIALYGVYPAKD
jgi:microcystin-dependent protein